MLFNLEVDTGDRVTGYLVPDGYSAEPIIRACSHGKQILVLPANELRESLVVAQRHENGRCGFTIDLKNLPELPNLSDLELFDHQTGLLIYRRLQSFMIQKKVLRLELHLLPLRHLDETIGSKFQYFAKGIENFGRETVTQMFLLNQVDSVYVSGRILYKNYSYFIDNGFQTILLIQNPYEELAERLLVLNKASQLGSDNLGVRDNLGLRSAIAFAESLPLHDEKAMRRALWQMPDDVAAILANPLVRQLTVTAPDEMPSGAAVASALDLLASFAVVGLRHEPDHFIQGVSELLNIDASQLPTVPQLSIVPTLARILQGTRAVDNLLEKDLELYHLVVKAFESSGL
jgi:hypothetical protein